MSDIVYRDPGPWGSGQGSNLTPTQVDTNFWILFSTLQQVQANIPLVEIAYFEVVGSTFYVVFTNHEVLGPYQLPQWEPNFVGEWLPNTPFNLNDSFWYNGSTYLVIFQGYPGAPTFNPFANDGLGHNYFSSPLLQCAGNMLPGNGQPGMVLTSITWQGAGDPPLMDWEYPELNKLFDVIVVSPLDNDDLLTWNTSHLKWTNAPRDGLLSLDQLSDVIIGSPLDIGQVIQWTGSQWVNAPVGSALTLEEISDVTISGAADGDLLQWNGGNWFNASMGGQLSVTSPASGDILQFNGSIWVNEPLGALFNVATLVSGQFLHYNGSNWINYALVPADLRFATSALGTTGTVSLDPTLADVFTCTPSNNITALNAASTPAGAKISIVFTTTGTSPFTVTFNTGFKTTGTLSTGSVSGKVFTMAFVSDGSHFCELSRTVAM